MKYGIDINNERILSAVSEKLRDRGNLIVDFTERENINTGRKLLKKVLIANITNIDFYFAIDFKDEISFCEIFYNEDKCSKVFVEKLINTLSDKFQNIICKSGKHLYLIKNVEAPVVYVRIPLKDEEKIGSLVVDKLINILENIKICNS